jgi:hypothetical protein
MSKYELKRYDEMLSRHIQRQDFVKINRTIMGEERSISGFLLALSKDFILMHAAEEFVLNGYYILRKDQFDSLRCNAFDKTQKRIMRAEGALAQFALPGEIDLQSWQTIFQSIKRLGLNAIIECEDRENPLFEIGPIKKVFKTQVHIQYHDPNGILEQKLTPVKYRDITLVTFGDRYSTTFKKYLKLR